MSSARAFLPSIIPQHENASVASPRCRQLKFLIRRDNTKQLKPDSLDNFSGAVFHGPFRDLMHNSNSYEFIGWSLALLVLGPASSHAAPASAFARDSKVGFVTRRRSRLAGKDCLRRNDSPAGQGPNADANGSYGFAGELQFCRRQRGSLCSASRDDRIQRCGNPRTLFRSARSEERRSDSAAGKTANSSTALPRRHHNFLISRNSRWRA